MILVGGSLLGVQAGAHLMHRLSDRRLTWTFGTFLIIVALAMLIR